MYFPPEEKKFYKNMDLTKPKSEALEGQLLDTE